ncbi:MAG TPA: fibronectin type III domain-containing protein [Terriglobales bacterium]|nr:fibronectin type III domain-containing protein [Terriglobales bacterium]
MKSKIAPLVMVILLGVAAVAQSNSSPYANSSNGSSAYGTSSSTPSTSSSSSDQMITNGPVAETVTQSNAVIGWSSKLPAHGTSVKYGTSRDRMTQTAQAAESSDAKNHHAQLENLSPDTPYYFQVMENGSPVGGIGTFRTVAEGEKPIQSKAVISQK